MNHPTMSTETQVSPGEETLIPTPEVVPPQAEAEESDLEVTPQETPEEAEGDKTIKRMERRIARRTADLYQERARATQAEQRAQELEALLRKQVPQETPPQEQVNPVELAKAIAKIERVAEKSNSVADKGRTQFKDFDAKLEAVIVEAGPLIERTGLPTPLGEAILEAEKPHALIHWLGANPEVASELKGLTPVQLGRRLDRIERDMAEARKPKTSTAPKPLEPVTPRAEATTLSRSGEDELAKLRAARRA